MGKPKCNLHGKCVCNVEQLQKYGEYVGCDDYEDCERRKADGVLVIDWRCRHLTNLRLDKMEGAFIH